MDDNIIFTLIEFGLSKSLISLIQESCSRGKNELKTTQLQKLLLD